MTHLKMMILSAASAVALFAGIANAEPQHAPPAGKAVDLQGLPPEDQREKMMMPFYNVLLEAHKQGDKVDLDALEAKIHTLAVEMSGGKAPSKEMEDHIMGVAHQAIAMGVSNPKMFESYKTFTAAMMGPQ